MKSIEELQADLKQLYAELEERRIMEQESVPQTVNFEELSSKAERYKIENHPMSNRDEHEQSMYLLLLISVIVLDETVYENSFSLLYRISHGMNFKGDVQELFLQAQQINFERIDDITRLFINDDVKLVMLMEAMMLAQGFKKEYKKAMEYIAELCILMKLEKEQVIVISNIARVVLTQNAEEYKCGIKNTYKVFDCYVIPYYRNDYIQCYKFEDVKVNKPGDWHRYDIKYLGTENDSIIFEISGVRLVYRSSRFYQDKVNDCINFEMPLNGNCLYYVNKEKMFFDFSDWTRGTPNSTIVTVYGKNMLFYSLAERNFPELFKED